MRYGLIGEHLPHSFSKEIHEQIADYTYDLKELSPDEVEGFIKARDFLGINVTIPYKQTVIPFLDEVDPAAKSIGAVNTIVNRSGRLYGYNTDFGGMVSLIKKTGIEIRGKKVLILGTGGTSKTAAAVAGALKAKRILRASRTGKKGALTYEEVYKNHSDADIIINTTPCGMFPEISECPVNCAYFSKLSGIIDAVYNPLRTRLVQWGIENQIKAAGGLYMLTAQAVLASELFLGTKYEEAVVDQVFNKIFSGRQNIVLTGMPNSGKTTVGNFLVRKTGRKLADTDRMIETAHNMKIADIFEKYGEDTFRKWEGEAVLEASKQTGAIIATGGGVILSKENVSALKQNGRIYFLDRPLEDLAPSKSRPLSSTREDLKKRYEERYPIYCETADEIISNPKTAEAAAINIIKCSRSCLPC